MLILRYLFKIQLSEICYIISAVYFTVIRFKSSSRPDYRLAGEILKFEFLKVKTFMAGFLTAPVNQIRDKHFYFLILFLRSIDSTPQQPWNLCCDLCVNVNLLFALTINSISDILHLGRTYPVGIRNTWFYFIFLLLGNDSIHCQLEQTSQQKRIYTALLFNAKCGPFTRFNSHAFLLCNILLLFALIALSLSLIIKTGQDTFDIIASTGLQYLAIF